MGSVITVDGLAGSGKTTLSQRLAAQVRWSHFNSGSLYRGVGYLAIAYRVDPDDEQAIAKLLAAHQLSIRVTPEQGTLVELNGAPLKADLTTAEISEATSRSSRHATVRARLLKMQQDLPNRVNLVAEGRDMGTVVFPDAPLKFFITASEEVRAERRLKQWRSEGIGLPSSEVELKQKLIKEIRERDERDSQRPVSPTKPASDAIILDNSSVSLTELVQTMYSFAREKGLV